MACLIKRLAVGTAVTAAVLGAGMIDPERAEAQILVATGQPVAQPMMQTATVTYMQGIFFRGGIGLGFGSYGASVADRDASYRLSGAGLAFDLALGASVAPNLALHGTVAGLALINPAISVSGASSAGGVTTTYTTANQDYTTALVGGGLTYYTWPFQGYFSVSVGAAAMRAEVRSAGGTTTVGQSGVGIGVNAVLGKEWVVGQHWGLGLAGQFLYTRVPDRDNSSSGDAVWNNFGVGLLFSATTY